MACPALDYDRSIRKLAVERGAVVLWDCKGIPHNPILISMLVRTHALAVAQPLRKIFCGGIASQTDAAEIRDSGRKQMYMGDVDARHHEAAAQVECNQAMAGGGVQDIFCCADSNELAILDYEGFSSGVLRQCALCRCSMRRP